MKIGTAIAAAVALIAISGTALGGDTAGPVPDGIKLDKHGQGWLLNDAKGMTLYTTILDQQPGVSGCVNACAKIWPPLAAPADAQPVGDWTTLTRPDGSKQWVYKGKPLYAFSSDTVPGNTYGDDVNLQWSVAVMSIATPADVTITKTLAGHVLADIKGMTLYTYDKDSATKSACDAVCARTHVPMIAPELAVARGDWSVVVRNDGTHQWAYQSRPLYRFSGDVHPTETLGDGVDGKKWHAAVLEPPPPIPTWVTVQGSDAGDLFADPAGRTLYIRNARRGGGGVVGAGPAAPNCGDECPGSPWQPVIAKADDKPIGNWSIVDRPDKQRQWAYRGQPVYTHALDKAPGDFRGIRTGDGRIFGTLMRNGQPMQGTGV